MHEVSIDNGIMQVGRSKDYEVQKYECSGKGITTSYMLCDGLQVVFMAFQTDDTFKPDTPKGDLIEISWCRKGRVECRFKNQTYTHVSEGDFWIDGGAFIPVEYEFPTGEFEAVTIIIDRDVLSPEWIEQFAACGIDIKTCCDVLGLDEDWYISRIDSRLHHIFQELCAAKQRESIAYFKIKTMEIMYYVDQLTKDMGREIIYYPKTQIDSVKRIWKYMITHLDEKCVLKDLAEAEGLYPSALRNIFTQMYGALPYTYLKKYKMDIAAKLLKDPDNKISDIAAALGYSNSSKFAAVFRETFGASPKEYQKK